jgi:hypothetical protein
MSGARAVYACVALAAVVIYVAAAPAEDARVELDGHQRATVIGRGVSTRAVVEQLCRQGGAAVRFDDQDAEFGVTVENEPLETALQSLLRGKSYLLRFRRDAAGGARVAGIHVLGPDGAGRRPEGRPASGFVVPFEMLEAAFGAASPEARDRGIEELMRNVGSDAERRRQFLATDPAVMARALRSFPEAPAVVSRIQTLAGNDAAVKAKLASLQSALQ